MSYEETAFFFPCMDESLLGVMAIPEDSRPSGVLIVVGGPQYRIGSHRQFVHLSRNLAARGISCMRFDYRGMGDSTGAMRTFEDIQPDIQAAVDAFLVRQPSLEGVVVWGLCDGASAAAFYGRNDPRVVSLVLVNPWVRTPHGEAKTYMRHYYMQRLFQRSFWLKLLSGRFQIVEALRSFASALAAALQGERSAPSTGRAVHSLPVRMAQDLSRYEGAMLFLLSGKDYTAEEFSGVASSSPLWKALFARSNVRSSKLADSDHTFSRKEWAEQVANLTAEWVSSVGSSRALSARR
jgi:exosortase A-associated hydrolase 1